MEAIGRVKNELTDKEMYYATKNCLDIISLIDKEKAAKIEEEINSFPIDFVYSEFYPSIRRKANKVIKERNRIITDLLIKRLLQSRTLQID